MSDTNLPVSQVHTLVAWAKSLVISTAEAYAEAADRLKQVKALATQIADHFRPMKRAADDAKRVILDAEKKLADPLAGVENAVKAAMIQYQKKEETIRREQEAKLQAEADERARIERERLELRSILAKTPEKKQMLEEQAAVVAAPVVHVPSSTPKIAGVSTKEVWKSRVVDPALVPRQFLIVDEKALDAYARAMKERASVPGVEFYPEQVMAASRR